MVMEDGRSRWRREGYAVAAEGEEEEMQWQRRKGR